MSTQPQIRPHVVTAPARKPSHRRTYIIVAVVCLALLAAGWAWSVYERTIQVEVISPTYQDIETSVSSTGVVVPVHDFQARANFSGIVEKVYVHVGQKVHAGQMLVQMKDQYALQRLDNARAALKAAQASLQDAEQNGTRDERIGFAEQLVQAQSEHDNAASALASLKKLAQRGSVSDAEVAAGQQRLNLATAALNALKQRMAHRYSPADVEGFKEKVRAEQDSVAAEKVSWGNANVSTPISGTVYIVPITQYDFVPGGSELMHVADLNHLEVRARFFEPDIAKLRVGEPVTVRWEGDPGKSWMGEVVAAPIAVDRSGPLTTGLAIIALTGHVDDLPVNSSVSVLVQSQKHAHVLAIPRQALHGAGANAFAYRLVGDKIRKTPVRAGLFNAMNVEITSGLNDRDKVVLRAVGDAKLRDGRRVEVKQNH